MAATRREPRRVRRVRKRAAFHAGRVREADSPRERMWAAELALLAAIVHAPNSARAARGVTGDAVEHARQLMDRPEVASLLACHERKYAAAGTDVARAGVALPWLRAAVASTPADGRDELYAHYATELAREAGQLRGER